MSNRLFIKLGEGLYLDMDKAKDLTKLIKKSIVDKNGHVKTVWVKVEETVKVGMRESTEEIFNNYFAMGFNERVGKIEETSLKALQTSKEMESKIVGAGLEHCGVFNLEGELIFTKKGEYDEIGFNKSEINIIRKAEIFTHNHPEDKSFSMKDVFMAISFGIKELRVITPNHVCSLKFSHKEKSQNKRETFDKYQYLFNIIDEHDKVETKKLKTLLNDKKITKDMYEVIKDHRIIKNIIKDKKVLLGFNIEYKVNKR